MKKVGNHFIVDAWYVPAKLISNSEVVRYALIEAISAGQATLIDLCIHQFSPHGVTATATLAESHIAIHTWPEHGYFAADLFFCGDAKPKEAIAKLVDLLGVKEMKVQSLERRFPGSAIMPDARAIYGVAESEYGGQQTTTTNELPVV